MSIKGSKTVWRSRMLDLRSEIGTEKTRLLNLLISKNLSFVWIEGGGLGQNLSKPFWAAYKSFQWEANPEEAVLEASPYIQWVYPRVDQGSLLMEFYLPSARDAVWTKNQWGIWEPDPRTAQKVDISQCAGVLVPGVAFDRQGHRLGYGKGFYDKALAGYRGLKVGVGFSVQVIEQTLPFDAWDVNMNLVVTETEIVRTKPERH